MSELLIVPHLGLGDAFVLNGLVRAMLSRESRLLFPCKHSYHETISQLFSDLPGIRVLRLSNDGAEADIELLALAHEAESKGFRTLRLGLFSKKLFDMKRWSAELYRHAHVNDTARWRYWVLPREYNREITPPSGEYVFVHDDIARNANIPKERIGPWKLERPDRNRKNILDYCALIENALEVHCIDSCFAILADHLTKPQTRRVLHLYCKRTVPPTYRQKWEILQ